MPWPSVTRASAGASPRTSDARASTRASRWLPIPFPRSDGMAAQPAIGEPGVGSARVFDIVFVDGAFVPTADAALSVHANAASYGTGTFEGIRATWNDEEGELYLLEAAAHFDRLRRSAN